MRGPGLLLLALFVAATPAWAQEPAGSPETPRAASAPTVADWPASGKLDDALVRRGDELARLRGRGTTRVVIGAVMLGLGLVLAGVSAELWLAGDAATGYANEGFNVYDQGAVAMDTIAFGLIGGGTSLVAIGAGNIAEAKRPRLFFGAAMVGAHL
ncbi:MAG TPA: hypothetical protein VF334_11960 [Polyangia bacterium]